METPRNFLFHTLLLSLYVTCYRVKPPRLSASLELAVAAVIGKTLFHMKPSVQRDVVVIGSGMGGLTTAALLSQAGLRVSVFEAQSQPGGYLSGFERNGFVFDTAIQWLNQCYPGGFVRRLFDYLGDDVPPCNPLERINRIQGTSFDYLLTSSPGTVENQLIETFPSDEKGIRNFFADARALGTRWRQMDTLIQSQETMGPFEAFVYAHKMLFWSFPLIRHLKVPVEKGLDRYFHDPELRSLFRYQESFIAMLMPVAWASIGNFHAPPRGGSRALVEWLCKKTEEASSEIVLNQRVARVLVNDEKQATGVELGNGQTVLAQHVVHAGDLQTLYDEMLPASSVSKRKQTAVRTADLYYSNFTVFLGLDCDAASLGFGEEILTLARDDISRDEQFGGDPEKTALTVLAPSVRDSSVAPAGKGILTIHCPALMKSHETWHTEDGRVRGAEYQKFKKQFAETLIRRVEEMFAPGLSNHIEVMEAATPVTYWRYTGNADGTIMGTRPSGKNIRARISGCQTPVKNLLLAGHWAHYSGGVPIAMQTGANTALLILKDLLPEAAQQLKEVMESPI